MLGNLAGRLLHAFMASGPVGYWLGTAALWLGGAWILYALLDEWGPVKRARDWVRGRFRG